MQKKEWDTLAQSESRSFENEYKKNCLNERECYYAVDKEIVGSHYRKLSRGEGWEKYMWWG